MSSWDTSPYSRVLFPTNCMPDKSPASRAVCGTESKHSRIQLCSFSSGGTNSSMGWTEELDWCEVPRLQRHLFEYQRVRARGNHSFGPKAMLALGFCPGRSRCIGVPAYRDLINRQLVLCPLRSAGRPVSGHSQPQKAMLPVPLRGITSRPS